MSTLGVAHLKKRKGEREGGTMPPLLPGAQRSSALSPPPPAFGSSSRFPHPGEVDGDDEAGEGRNGARLVGLSSGLFQYPLCTLPSLSLLLLPPLCFFLPMLLHSSLDLDLDLASPDLALARTRPATRLCLSCVSPVTAPNPLSQPS